MYEGYLHTCTYVVCLYSTVRAV